MKTYQIQPVTAAAKATVIERMPSLLRRLGVLERLHPEAGGRTPVCLGADLEKAGACLAIQVGAVCAGGDDYALPGGGGGAGRGTHRARVAGGGGVEACGFGWLFQRRLRGAGAAVRPAGILLVAARSTLPALPMNRDSTPGLFP